MYVRQITLICISYVGHQVLLVGRFSVCYLLLFCQISELDFTTCHLKLTVRELVGWLSLSGRYHIGQCLKILSIEPICNLDVQSCLHCGPMLVKVTVTSIAIPLLNCFTDCSKSVCSSGGVLICSIGEFLVLPFVSE